MDSSKNGRAVASLILGIVGLIAWLIPLFGLPVTIIGTVLGAHGMKSEMKAMAIVGMVLSIIGLVLAAGNSLLGMYLGATGQLY